ncbi:D-aminoacylase [Chloracidobacterium validum]|uniref:D-aminoacylase n=2 Tax=Chloracidobacterium validum TaxID=2821543 RepID=A0ABX8BCT0_9BACT|nr:D-aminoacylase [Chloracidobacterium validum]
MSRPKQPLWWLVLLVLVSGSWGPAWRAAAHAPLMISSSSDEKTAGYDVLIKNARVVDGTGNPWFRADVALRDGRIARVGRHLPGTARVVVDAKDRILAPGFIDVHAHVEDIFSYPDAENFIRMGVTTLVTGNCGASVTNVGEFLGRYRETPLTVNLATLIAHGSVRAAVMKYADREPTADELAEMKRLVAKAMEEGAVGLSTGLIYAPGSFAKTDEVIALAEVAGAAGGLYVTHMRNEGNGVLEAIEEALTIGERAKLPVDISHLKVATPRLWRQSDRVLGLIRAARARGLEVTVDQYAYTASSTSLESMLPNWVLAGGQQEARQRLADPATRERVKRELRESLESKQRTDFSYAVVAFYGANLDYNGKNLVEVTRLAQETDSLDAQLEQIVVMYEQGGAGMIYHSMHEDDVARIMREPFTMVASDAGVRKVGVGSPHPRGYGNNARVLGRYVRELGVLTLEDAVRKMTSLPARTFRLGQRGLIREGFIADLVLFDDRTIQDTSTYEDPHHFPTGVDAVWVNGSLVFQDGKLTGARPGQPVRRAVLGEVE